MWPAYCGTTSLCAGLTHLRATLDALRRSAKLLFAPTNEWAVSSTLYDAAIPPVDDQPFVNDGKCSTAHLSSVAIVALLGLDYIDTMPPTPPGPFHYICSEPSARPTRSSPHDLDFDIDVEAILGDEIPNSRVPTLFAYSPHTPSVSTSPAPAASPLHGVSQLSSSTAYSPASQSSLLSTASTPYASSSSADSDSSFEVASPPTDAVEIPASLQRPSDELAPLSDSAEDKVSDNDTFSRRIEAEVLALAHRLEEEARQKELNGAPLTAAAISPADVSPVVYPDPLFNDSTTDSTDTQAASDSAIAAAGSENDDEGAWILCSPHSDERYVLEGVVAKGGSARVVRAVDNKGDLRAVKMVLKQKVFTWPDARENLLREKDIMARVAGLDTWRLAYLYESWEDEDMIFFVMVSSLGPLFLSMSCLIFFSPGTLTMLFTLPHKSPV